ncbi:cytochrome c biogenesis protein ResB [Diaphorobacter ruginosibacter]|uniref:Cytochrome c biogenesis protein ResB n=1 Tax=Diaphorobacter ruginosibacter TaxID=1715720 RepID=A0A7G9RQY7_9BURK|nr:cytochrome c biogenesis protein ResB [Diaphorobacter ruginosibacter]QNN58012.1 cytochrome c biogenesis protein ResB [Diaphorobacter ruginosibacter]
MSDAAPELPASTSTQKGRSLTELLASMRFAISLLTVICIASVIGTVLKQHEPAVNYVNQFGPFWADLFLSLKLNAVYSAWWFLLILAFLVVSTSLCVARHAPKYLADIRTYKENIREKSLNAFHHKASAELTGAPQDEAQRLGKLLVSGGWKVKLQQRDTAAGAGTGWMLAAKAGAANKLGYIAAHSAIVLICLGGLFDGDLVVRAQMLLGGKTPYTGGGLISEVSDTHRLSERNPTFRGNLLVAEGTQSSTAILNQSDGILLQELPFAIELKKFIVDYYSTGMPKLFASEIIIHDKETGEKKETRVEVNHPASYKGVEIYQSSFDDGGSKVHLQARSFQQGIRPFMVEGEIGGSLKLPAEEIGGQPATLEFTALRVLNVENLSGGGGSEVDVRKVDLKHSIESRLGAGNKSATKRDLRNVGPSITYKLRDASGQAREFVNYMLPVDTGDGLPVFLLGVRETPADPFRYLRVPVDTEGSIDGFLRLRQALSDPAAREAAVKRYTMQALDDKRPELSNQLYQSALRALTLFAEGDSRNGQKLVGLQAVSDFIEANVPEAERSRAGEVLVRILNGALYELAQLSRHKAGLAPMAPDEKTQAFMTQAVLSLSDVQLYPAPVFFELKNFEQVQASVFQVARAPGKTIVYLGCLFLIIGVFAMLYVRERRIWIWFTPADQGSKAVMAMSTNRKTLDGDKEFETLSGKLLGIASHPGGNAT